MFRQRFPAGRREATTVRLRRRAIEATFQQELAGQLTVRCGQLVGVELLRQPMCLHETGPLAVLPDGRRAALLVAQLDSHVAGQPFDRLDEGQVIDLLHEPDDVAALPAAEAEPEVA